MFLICLFGRPYKDSRGLFLKKRHEQHTLELQFVFSFIYFFIFGQRRNRAAHEENGITDIACVGVRAYPRHLPCFLSSLLFRKENII